MSEIAEFGSALEIAEFGFSGANTSGTINTNRLVSSDRLIQAGGANTSGTIDINRLINPDQLIQAG